MDLDRIKQFAVSHFEKFLFGIFAVIAGLLIYSGTQKENFMEAERTSPDQLSSLATRVKSDIDIDHSEAILKDRRREDLNIIERTKLRDQPVVESPYQPEKYWEDLDPGSVIRRTDPVLAKPIDLRVRSVVTSIAQTSRTEGGYPLDLLEPADPVEKEVQRQRPEPRPRGRGGRGGQGDRMAMEMMMSQMSGMGGQMAEMENSRGGPMPGTTGPTRRLDSENDLSGYRPKPEKTLFPQPKVWSFIAGVALLPYKDVYKEYEQALSEADGYNPGRDVPVYHDLQIQRADVTGRSVADLTEDDWQTQFDRITHYRLARRDWVGFAPEIVPGDYRDEALTLHIPPVLLDDYYDYTTHERLPKIGKTELARQEQTSTVVEDVIDLDADLQGDGDVLVGPGAAAGGGGRGGYGSGMSMSMGGYGGEASFQGGMSIGRGQLETNPVEHKLIRFFDFAGILRTAPKPGRQYVYRVRYGVVDPNFPQIKELQPATSTLDPATAARVSGLVAQAEKAGTRDGLWVRYSDWSDPTSPVSLSDLSDQFVGPITPPKSAIVIQDGQRTEIPRELPTVNFVTAQFDTTLGTRVPIAAEFQPGMTLATTAESTDVIDPVSLEIKKVEGEAARVNNLTTVVDISGADPMANDDELKSPGNVLLMNTDGSIHVRDDVDDQRLYRIYSFAEERGK